MSGCDMPRYLSRGLCIWLICISPASCPFHASTRQRDSRHITLEMVGHSSAGQPADIAVSYHSPHLPCSVRDMATQSISFRFGFVLVVVGIPLVGGGKATTDFDLVGIDVGIVSDSPGAGDIADSTRVVAVPATRMIFNTRCLSFCVAF